MAKSKIEWTEKVWNPVTGCTPISPGCENCYAQRMAHRLAAMGQDGYDPADPFKVQTRQRRVTEPVYWKKPARIFVCSMSDLFHDDVPDSFLDQVFNTMAKAYHHTYLILTKRPERMQKYIRTTTEFDKGWPQIWLGVTVENQEQADIRIPLLLKTPAAVRFVSYEPALGPVDLRSYLGTVHEDECGVENTDQSIPNSMGIPFHDPWVSGLDWVIAGGESGPKARPAHPDWFRLVRDDCAAAGVPFFFKQWGEWLPDESGNTSNQPDYWANFNNHKVPMFRVGKHRAG